MKQYNDIDSLVGFLCEEGLRVSSLQREKLEKYLKRLKTFSLSHRIVSRSDVDFIVEKHFLSSFYFVKQLRESIVVGDNILDLGSGAGRHLVKLKDTEFYLVDFSERMLKLAEKKAKQLRIKIKTIQSELTKLPFKDNFLIMQFAFLHSIVLKRKKISKNLLKNSIGF